METYHARRASGPVFYSPISPAVPRSSSAPFASSSTAAAFSSSTQSPSYQHHHESHERSATTTRINLAGPAAFVQSQAIARRPSSPAVSRKSCICTPTTNPGSFRCKLHRGFQIDQGWSHRAQAAASHSNRLNMRGSAMANSLVRRALAASIRPISQQLRRREVFQQQLRRREVFQQQLRRREVFQRRPSRLSVMSKADD